MYVKLILLKKYKFFCPVEDGSNQFYITILASGSGVGSNINNSQKDGNMEGQSNMHDKNIRDGPNEGESFRENELDLNNLPMDPG